MKKLLIISVFLSYFFSCFGQQFSILEETGIFSQHKSFNQKSDTSFRITHSLSQTIDQNTSVSCNSGGVHFENSYYRVFDLFNHFKLNGDWSVQNIELGIGLAQSGTGTIQPCMLRLWTMSEYNGSSFILDSLTFKGDTINFEINDNETGTIKNIVVDPPISIPFGNVLVVEVLVPDGHENNHMFFIGSNEEEQTDNTYIRASGCDVSIPTNVVELGFGDMSLVLNAIGAYNAANPEILSFDIEGQLVDTEIVNNPDFTIKIIMPADTSLVALTPQISVPLGFYISPSSGLEVDFSFGPVEYAVTNEYAKISQSWFVDVINAGPDITAVKIQNQNGETVIDNVNHQVTVPVPFGTDLKNLSPNITIYDGFLITPESDVSQDFSTGAVIYTVTHESLPLTQDWELSVYEAENTGIHTLNDCIKLFPNPASYFTQIEGEDITKIEVLNHLGKFLFSTEGKLIQTENIKQGMYLLRIHTLKGIALKKMIVVR